MSFKTLFDLVTVCGVLGFRDTSLGVETELVLWVSKANSIGVETDSARGINDTDGLEIKIRSYVIHDSH